MDSFKKTNRKDRIVILQSLPPGRYENKQSGEEIYDEIIKNKGVDTAEFYEFYSSKELSSLLQHLNDTIEEGQSLIIHFETHGSMQGGMCVYPNSEIIPWENLLEMLAPLSKNLDGNLILILSMCLSNTIQDCENLNSIQIKNLIVSTRTINRMEIIRGFRAFYSKYISPSNIGDAINVLISKTKDCDGNSAFAII